MAQVQRPNPLPAWEVLASEPCKWLADGSCSLVQFWMTVCCVLQSDFRISQLINVGSHSSASHWNVITADGSVYSFHLIFMCTGSVELAGC